MTGTRFEDAYKQDGLLFGDRPTRLLEQYLNDNPTSGEALDLGCGDGRDTIPLLRRGLRVTAVDGAQSAIEKLTSRPDATDLRESLTAVHADLREWQWPIARFDLVVAVTLLDHLCGEEMARIIQGMLSAAKPGATFYIEVHTVDDPSITGKGTVSEFASEIGHYFDHNELLRMFLPHMRIIFYHERQEWDYDHGLPHTHGFATLIGKLHSKKGEDYHD